MIIVETKLDAYYPTMITPKPSDVIETSMAGETSKGR